MIVVEVLPISDILIVLMCMMAFYQKRECIYFSFSFFSSSVQKRGGTAANGKGERGEVWTGATTNARIWWNQAGTVAAADYFKERRFSETVETPSRPLHSRTTLCRTLFRSARPFRHKPRVGHRQCSASLRLSLSVLSSEDALSEIWIKLMFVLFIFWKSVNYFKFNYK